MVCAAVLRMGSLDLVFVCSDPGEMLGGVVVVAGSLADNDRGERRERSRKDRNGEKNHPFTLSPPETGNLSP